MEMENRKWMKAPKTVKSNQMLTREDGRDNLKKKKNFALYEILHMQVR